MSWGKAVLALAQLAMLVATWARENGLLSQGQQQELAHNVSNWLADLRKADAARDNVRASVAHGGLQSDEFDRDAVPGKPPAAGGK